MSKKKLEEAIFVKNLLYLIVTSTPVAALYYIVWNCDFKKSFHISAPEKAKVLSYQGQTSEAYIAHLRVERLFWVPLKIAKGGGKSSSN